MKYFVSPEMEGQDINICLDCTAGSYCPGTGNVDPIICDKGNYSDTGASACTTCEAGRYCDQNTTSLTFMDTHRICPAGVECPPGMSYMPDLIQDQCRVGHYCPSGDVSRYPIACPIGTYNPDTGRKELADCVQCTPGWYCDVTGLSAPVDECPGGYYCPEGTGANISFPCPIGFYRNSSAKESFQDCTECISGFYCNVEGLAVPIDCPPGYFCVSGSITPQPCPLGTYSNSTGLRRSTDCTPCPGGWYCDGIGTTEPKDLCDAGFYCREKAYTSAPPDGPTGGLCPAGGYCPRGSATSTPCPVGYYSNFDGADDENDCIPCDPGFFCAGSAGTGATEQCEAGYYCTGGAGTPTQFDTPIGHYTLAGAWKPEPCPRGQYQPAERMSSCLSCPQGYYCNTTGGADNIICPRGHYCPEGSEYPTQCPPGTYTPNEGQPSIDQCDLCRQGYACESYGMNATDVTPCSAGYYCLQGSNTSIPVGMPFGDICPPGSYCPEGTASYNDTKCPNGTYSNLTSLSSESECLACDPGLVCAGYGLLEPNGICAAGYFCRGSAFTSKPRDGGVTGDICPKGQSETLLFLFQVKYLSQGFLLNSFRLVLGICVLCKGNCLLFTDISTTIIIIIHDVDQKITF